MSADYCSFCDTRCNCGEGGLDHVVMLQGDLFIVCNTCMDDTTLLTQDNKPITFRQLVNGDSFCTSTEPIDTDNAYEDFQHSLLCGDI
jgi:hypothetical protein